MAEVGVSKNENYQKEEKHFTMQEWAENEVKLVIEKDGKNGDSSPELLEMTKSCYESALKGYKAVCEDEHSGYSFSVTRNILTRLMNGAPLTPITEEDEFYPCRFDDDKIPVKTFQCLRMSSLFKDVAKSGEVRYSDVERTVCVDVKKGYTYHAGYGDKLVDELFPIKLPYYPPVQKFKVYMQDFCVDKNNGDFDHVWVQKIKTPDGVDVSVNKYFDCTGTNYKEITYEEFDAAMKKGGISWK